MKGKGKKVNLNSWSGIKDKVYGKKGTKRRDDLESESESFKIGLLLKDARKSRNLTQ